MAADENGAGTDLMETAPLMVNAQYIKDLSFEVPDAPEIFEKIDSEPEMDFQINVASQQMGERQFEVILMIEVNASVSGNQLFILELHYAGLFEINDQIDEKYIGSLIMVECPHLLFPFARAIIASVTQESGLPPLMVPPIDFNALAAAQMGQGAGNA